MYYVKRNVLWRQLAMLLYSINIFLVHPIQYLNIQPRVQTMYEMVHRTKLSLLINQLEHFL